MIDQDGKPRILVGCRTNIPVSGLCSDFGRTASQETIRSICKKNVSSDHRVADQQAVRRRPSHYQSPELLRHKEMSAAP